MLHAKLACIFYQVDEKEIEILGCVMWTPILLVPIRWLTNKQFVAIIFTLEIVILRRAIYFILDNKIYKCAYFISFNISKGYVHCFIDCQTSDDVIERLECARRSKEMSRLYSYHTITCTTTNQKLKYQSLIILFEINVAVFWNKIR